MSKTALEMFRDIKEFETPDGSEITVADIVPYFCEKIEKALQRLEAIDNAEPSEALDYLNQFINEMTYCLEHPNEYAKGYEKEIFYKYKSTFETTIKQALIKAQEQDFNYKNIVIPFFDELTNVLGTNDIDEMLDKIKEQEKENELLREIIKSFFDKGSPLHQYIDNKFGLTIEVDNECSIMHLGEFKGVDLDKYLKGVLESD